MQNYQNPISYGEIFCGRARLVLLFAVHGSCHPPPSQPLGITTYGICKLDVHGSVHHNTNLIEMTNKMQLCIKIYYSIVS